MSDVKPCPFCGEEIKSVAKKCKHCGSWLEEQVKKEIVKKQKECPICAELIDEDVKICPYCKSETAAKKEANTDANLNEISKYFQFKSPDRVLFAVIGAIMLFFTREVPMFVVKASASLFGVSNSTKVSYTLAKLSEMPKHELFGFLCWAIIVISVLTILIAYKEKFNKMIIPLFGSFACLVIVLIGWAMEVSASNKQLSELGLSSVAQSSMSADWGFLVLIGAVALIFVASSSALSKTVYSMLPIKPLKDFVTSLLK